MPDKEGAEEKTTKDVVTKKQKQLMNKEEFVQEMPDDVKNIMMKGLRKGAGEFSKGGDPKNIIKKGVKSTIKNVIKSKSVQNFLNNEYIPEEGYDVARDQGRVKPSKDKKDATTMPRSKEMEKTRKVNKGPSALERVKADIEKRYGKGAIMNVSKEELDLTKVAEAFGGYIVEKKVGKVKPGEVEASLEAIRRQAEKPDLSPAGKKRLKKISNPTKITDQNFERLKKRVSGEISADADDMNTVANRTKSGSQSRIETGTYNYSKNKPKPTKKRNLFPKSGSKNTPEFKKVKAGIDAKSPTYRSSVTGNKLPVSRKNVKAAVQGGVKSPAAAIKKVTSAVPKQTQAVKNVAKKLTVGGKSIGKTVGKAAAGGLAKRTLGRAGAKLLAKQIPGIGTVISGGEAIARFAAGDVVGGALSAAEMIPGLGLLAGTANVARDIGRTRRAVKTIKKLKPLSKGMKLVQKSKAGRTLSKMQRTARKNPLATVVGGGVATGVGVDTATGMRRGKLPKVTRPKLGQGVVGRRTAG